MYQHDPHLMERARVCGLATNALLRAQATNYRVSEATAQHDDARRKLDGYIAATRLLSEEEREHQIAFGLSAPEMVYARELVPPDSYREAVDGSSALSIRDCLVELVTRGRLAESDLPSLPKDVREGAALVAAVTRAIVSIAQGLRQKRFEPGQVSALAFAAQKLGKARGENAGEVTSLVDSVRSAIAKKDAGAVRDALEQLAKFFDVEISAPAPIAANRAVVFGRDVGLVTQIA